jgi:hypothetical protein
MRGTLYRCHLFTFGGPQTAGIAARWTKNLAAVGNREVRSGEIVEMVATVPGDVLSLDRNSKIRFDVLEEDHLLTGLLDDRIVSYVGTHAALPTEPFPSVVPRRTNFERLVVGRTFQMAVDAFKQRHPTDWFNHILIVEEPGAPSTFHVLTWWAAERLEDFLNSEFYFIVNVDNAIEDQSEQILDVTGDAADPVEVWPVEHPEAAGPFAVGQTTYVAPNFTIPAGLEGAAFPVDVTMEALVRYPADRAGVDVPVSTARTSYPVVILAHGRHAASEVERHPDGSRKIVLGMLVPIRDLAGNRVEFQNHEGLEYLAAHLASHGFIAVSVNLNGLFNPITGSGELASLAGSALLSCVPFLLDGVGVEHRGLTVLRHITEIRTRNSAFGPLLGTVPPVLEPELARGGRVSDPLRQAFASIGTTLAESATTSIEVAGSRWLLTDLDRKAQFYVRKELGSLNVYRATVFHKADLTRIGLVGHSRGGEAVVSAHDIDKGLPPATRANIKAIVSIAPTDFRNITVDAPYLVLVGSDDGDVSSVHGLRLYDRSLLPKQLVWVVGGIHNFFSSNWHWQDEVTVSPSVLRLHHQVIASGYATAFFQQHLNGLFFHRTADGTAPLQWLFSGGRTLQALAGSAVELFHASRATRTLVVDNFQDAPRDKTKNSLGESVTEVDVAAQDELDVRNLAPGGPPCAVHFSNWFHDTQGMRLEWGVATAKYTTGLGARSALDFDAVSFRVGQDTPTGTPQDLKVRLTDTTGEHASLRVSDFGRIPPPRTKDVITSRDPFTGVATATTPVTMSMLATVRMPLSMFKATTPRLDLGSLASITFEFSERSAGRLVFDDIELSA